ncbi:hypothetical protein HaLaN_32103, partial [Haematococcus lacustris]
MEREAYIEQVSDGMRVQH